MLHSHCADVGRDPAEIRRARSTSAWPWTRTACAQQFGGIADFVRPGVLIGSDEQVLERVAEYVEAGADQVNMALRAPFDRDALTRFATILGGA